MHCDLLVIGGEPAAYYGAVAATRLNKRVALVERPRIELGDVSLPVASIRPETLRDVFRQVRGQCERRQPVDGNHNGARAAMNDVRRRLIRSFERDRAAEFAEFERNGIDVHTGKVSFADSHTVFVLGANGTLCVESDRFLIAAGTRPARCWQHPPDGRRVYNTDNVLHIDRVPRSLIVVGGGAHGVAHAMLFAALGTQVTVVDGGDGIDGAQEMDASLDISIRLRAEGVGVDLMEQERVAVLLKDGERLIAESVLFATGRVGDTGDLNLEVAGLRPDERGRLWCNDNLQTWVPHIYGAGDVVGFPQQSGTAQVQAERAMRHAFGDDTSIDRSRPREERRLESAAADAEGLDVPAGDLATV